jgi:hypothetical protein
MHRHLTWLPYGLFLLLNLGAGGGQAFAATPGFTITASNAAMPTSGFGSIPFTLTSVDGYAGTFTANCAPADPPAGARLPICGSPTAPTQYTLTANQTVKGSVTLLPYPVPSPASRLAVPSHEAEAAWAFAGALLLGFGFRRRRFRWPALLVLAAGALIGLTGVGACGGGGTETLTPGTYAYVVTATDTGTDATANVTVNVTVPAGIPAKM